jgi:hypothetical protein
MRAGIRKSDLLHGMTVTVTGNPMRDGQPKATWLKAVRLTDNRELVPMRGFVPH